MFPEFLGKRAQHINLNEEAKLWRKENKPSHRENPFLQPLWCAQFIEQLHAQKGIDWSYGGYLEDRSTLWKGLYLERHNTFIHLGVDLNVPAGTQVATDFDAIVHHVDIDTDREGGWGGRVIVQPPKRYDKGYLFIYAHLAVRWSPFWEKEGLRVGDSLPKGTVIGRVGTPAENGGWYPHLHVQMIRRDFFDTIKKQDKLSLLDGYDSKDELDRIRAYFPNPTQYLVL